ncbi:MAG TPA: hypothetical protein VGM86_05635 [Thermoanaerobaculia bacterium]
MAEEANRRYRTTLKKPVDARAASTVLRRLRDAGELQQIQSGGAAHEALLIPSPIRKALSTIRGHQVAHLLMGGQACVLYGAAEFSRDLDLALLPDPAKVPQQRRRLRSSFHEIF